MAYDFDLRDVHIDDIEMHIIKTADDFLQDCPPSTFVMLAEVFVREGTGDFGRVSSRLDRFFHKMTNVAVRR